MGRRKDPLWRHVNQLDNNHFRCKYCKIVYAGGASRIKSHLSSIEGGGIKNCPKVPRHVQREANRAIKGPSRRRIISTSSRNRINEVGSHTRGNEDETTMGLGDDDMGIQQEAARQIEGTRRKRKAFSSSSDDEVSNEVSTSSPTREIEGTSRKRKASSSSSDDEVSNEVSTSSQNQNKEIGSQERGDGDGSPMEVQNPDQEAEEERISLHADDGNHIGNNIEESLQHVPTKGIKLLTTTLVGKDFLRNMDKIWAWLVNEDVLSIGIYGMAGTGKTELVKHINNKLLNDTNPFHHVYWFTVPQDISFIQLQNEIAKMFDLDLSLEVDHNKRAAKLSEALVRNGKSILILDSVWNDIDFHRMGITTNIQGCRLVLTTRSYTVCRKIGCQEVVEVQLLSEEESWDLFKKNLGDQTGLTKDCIIFAECVAGECDGLPLALTTVARSMKGADNWAEWSNALEKLKELIPRQDDMEVLQKLRLSYDYLNDSAMQQFFLYCALFPEAFKIKEKDLYEYLIVEGIIERKKTRLAEQSEGIAILERLYNNCLLKRGGLGMHRWIRKMAYQIQSSSVMVETGRELEELPDKEKWTENLLRVSLMNTSIEEIPPDHSPRCSNLSTLLLGSNQKLKLIADSFFENLPGLKILDLSCTAIETLPDSVSNLVRLIALLLRGCKKLRHVPSLEKLQAMEKLDISDSGVEEVPKGVELLSKLTYLDFSGSKLMELPTGIFSKLSRLQVLKLDLSLLIVDGEVERLLKLEVLQCHLRDPSRHISNLARPLLTCYNILVGQKKVLLHYWTIGENFIVLPPGIEELEIKCCNYVAYKCWRIRDIPTLEDATQLKSIKIKQCFNLECLFSIYSHISARIEILWLEGLITLRALFDGEGADPPSLSLSNGHFSHLRQLKVIECSIIKTLFPHALISNLRNLEELEIRNCSQMEEIIAEAKEDEGAIGDATANMEIDLPKLKYLHLKSLKELKSIHSRKIVCSSLQYILVYDCLKLNRMPLSLSLIDDNQLSPSDGLVELPLFFLKNRRPSSHHSLREIKVSPEEWWEKVEWDHHAKNVLLPYCTISDERSDS